MTDESKTSLNDVLESIREVSCTVISFSTQLKYCDSERWAKKARICLLVLLTFLKNAQWVRFEKDLRLKSAHTSIKFLEDSEACLLSCRVNQK